MTVQCFEPFFVSAVSSFIFAATPITRCGVPSLSFDKDFRSLGLTVYPA
jgi:hypothetical protein